MSPTVSVPITMIIEHEFRILVLEAVVDTLMARFPIVGPPIRPDEMQQIRERALQRIKQRYPDAQIQLPKP